MPDKILGNRLGTRRFPVVYPLRYSPRSAMFVDWLGHFQRVQVQEQRLHIDRRERPTPFLSRYWLRGRRREARRAEEETAGHYVDRYRSGEWLLVAGIFLLSMADLVLTIFHLRAGGREANPLMDLAVRNSEETFVLVKTATTAFGLSILLVHIRFRRVRPTLNLVLAIYGGILVYHLLLRFGVL